MKTNNTTNSRRLATFLSIALLGPLIFASGCARKELRVAKVSGEVMTDTKGRKWLVEHRIGDVFTLKSVNQDGSVNVP